MEAEPAAMPSPSDRQIRTGTYTGRRGPRISLDVRRTSMRRSKEEPIDYIVWVDPQKYYEYEYAKKPDVARLISRINSILRIRIRS